MSRIFCQLLIALVCVGFISSPARAQFTFAPPSDYSVEFGSLALTTGDFNGDRFPDLAVGANAKIALLLNRGDGVFTLGKLIALGQSPSAMVSGDFNMDGVTDLVAANAFDNSVSVLLGQGDGSYKSRMDYMVGRQPNSLAVDDFNGDGLPDLIAASVEDATLRPLVNKGDGTFVVGNTIRTGGYYVTSGDFNGDHRPDLAVMEGFYLRILLNRTPAGSQDLIWEPMPEHPGEYAWTIVHGDFDKDGKEDLAILQVWYREKVSVLFGNGDGTFGRETAYSTSGNPTGLCVADFDGDGNLDMAVANNVGQSISVLLNHGDGTFSSRVDFPAPNLLRLVTADFNGDGKQDLASVNGYVQVLLNQSGKPGAVIGDLNGDDRVDIKDVQLSLEVAVGLRSPIFQNDTNQDSQQNLGDTLRILAQVTRQ